MSSDTEASNESLSGSGATNRFPPQIKFIIGNEAAERYSFYGMKAILTLFMTNYLFFEKDWATSVYHLFVMAVYFTALFGAFLSDRYWGKYRTIMTLSFVYIAGHAVLAVWENEVGLYAGLILIALGAGGIKPCVSAHVGDQFTKSSAHLIAKVFNVFYFSINFGSFFATLITPYTREWFGPHVAFGIPGILMALATFVFWLGRKHYVNVPPTGPRKDSPGRVLFSLATKGAQKTKSLFGDIKLEEARAVASVGILLLPVVMFWALFDQTGSSWVLLTENLNLHGRIEPDSLQAANPLLVMGAIPLFVWVIYPWIEKMGIKLNPLRKIGAGLFLTAVSFVPVAIISFMVEGGAKPSALWMILPYALLTAAEVLVSITGIEFAYTQAPRSAKSTVMSLWFLTVALGNLMVAVVTPLNPFKGGTAFLFWAAITTAVAFVFIILAKRYKFRSYIEDDNAPRHEVAEVPSAVAKEKKS